MNNYDKISINHSLYEAEVIGIYDASENDTIRFVVEDAGAGNVLDIYLKLQAQENWNLVKSFSGSGSFIIDTTTYDTMKVDCSSFDGTAVKILASGFNNEI